MQQGVPTISSAWARIGREKKGMPSARKSVRRPHTLTRLPNGEVFRCSYNVVNDPFVPSLYKTNPLMEESIRKLRAAKHPTTPSQQ